MRAWYWLLLRAKTKIDLILDPLLMICDSKSMVSHVQREGNSAAHRLAWLGLTCTQEIVWFKEHPDLIQDILFKEGL
ncbi:hypothetical protein DVH24_011269 [Malus domestica]|uniref:RNase H type-1 domain-containing protein n=1 Tax=Malus domestica TaxID=3750 RepID=A0A498JYS3_MALDO|nr:hypothetical protein DVH24_011269 [Malus domestica]